MKNNLKNLQYLIEYLFVIVIFFILNLLPIKLVSFLGGGLFRLLGPFSKSHKIALSNFKKVFYNLKDKEIKEKVMESWENLGRTIFELSILNKIVDKKNNKISIEGVENIENLIKNDDQVIFFCIHQSNWEIVVPSIDKLGIKVGAIYRHINNKFINKLVLNKRNETINIDKSFYTPKGKKSARDIIDAIKNKSSILIVVDQKDSAGEIVKLFNIKTKTQTGFLKVARKNKLKLIPVKNTRIKKNNFILSFCSPLEPNNLSKNDNETMNIIHKIIEKWILENPTQWFWQHNRFN